MVAVVVLAPVELSAGVSSGGALCSVSGVCVDEVSTGGADTSPPSSEPPVSAEMITMARMMTTTAARIISASLNLLFITHTSLGSGL